MVNVFIIFDPKVYQSGCMMSKYFAKKHVFDIGDKYDLLSKQIFC